MIADAERAAAVAGVMGGATPRSTHGTTRIVLESAYFHPPSVRRTSKRLGLKTEASTRFERGADVNAPPAGIARAAALLEQIGAGRAVGPLIDRYPVAASRRQIALRASRIARLLGQDVPAADVPRPPAAARLRRSRTRANGWTVTVPTFRVDVAREVDLIEEVGRHYGFDRIPATFPALDGAATAAGPGDRARARAPAAARSPAASPRR